MFHAGGQAEGRTDMTKLTVAVHNFTNVFKEKKHGSLIDRILRRT